MNRIGKWARWALLSGAMAVVSVGALAQKMPDAEFQKLAATAKTAQEHTRLAQHYKAHAAEHEAEAKMHEAVAKQFASKKPLDDESWDMSRDSLHYAQHSREAAQVLRDLAAAHDGSAERMGGKKK
ncbi:MAG: hypothetical protein ABL995_18925 [Bryobacteraceae bacterium]